MESAQSIQDRADRVRAALGAAFGVRAKTLNKALRRTGRRLPRRLHKDAQKIVAAQAFGDHPVLMRRVDGAALGLAEERVVTYLQGIDRNDRRKGLWLGIASGLALNVILICFVVVFWMWWTGRV